MQRPMTAVAPLLLGLALTAATGHAQTVLHVNINAPDGGDGAEWFTAYNELPDALDAALSSIDPVEIWVAEGTYRPDRGTGDRTASFELSSQLTLLGGFLGVEWALGDRDPDAHPTILTGDLEDNDGPAFTGFEDNAQNVITAQGVEDALIDGFTVTGGNGDFAGALLLGGGALFAQASAVTINDCTFTANSVGLGTPTLGNFGGAVYLKESGALTVTNCRFEGNRSNSGGALGSFALGDDDLLITITDSQFTDNAAGGQLGGAIYLARGEYVIERCTFTNNESDFGGAIFGVLSTRIEIRDTAFTDNEGTVQGGAIWFDRCDDGDLTPATFERCSFVGNRATIFGGALRLDETVSHFTHVRFLGNEAFRLGFGGQPEGIGGALFIDLENGHKFTNCLVTGNFGGTVGGIVLSRCSATMVNTTVAHNGTYGLSLGAGMLVFDTLLTMGNSVLWGNGTAATEAVQILFDVSPANVAHSIIEGWTGALGGPGNFGDDPEFVDADGADDVLGTSDDRLDLQAGSPAIDAGDNSLLPPDLLTDLDGNDRIINRTVDIGAFEFALTADLDGSGLVDFGDLLVVLGAWGPCPAFLPCPADLDGNGSVDFGDLLVIISSWS